ncbi:MAG: DUF2752 domain-containing protein, partial [Clostridiales bacterium]|nr:DUF2752 domain-containing protein [Clostridiales bacterium]
MKKKVETLVLSAKKNWIVIALTVGYLSFAQFFTGTVCPFDSLFGIPCPSCGSTRAIISLIKGDMVGYM